MNANTSMIRRPAFTLVELLTVIFIISLLIAILVPSLGAARNAAKKASTQSAMKAIDVGLEMFKNEQGRDFAQTNGYPPSFAHPPINDKDGNVVFGPQDAIQGRFPFSEGKPRVYGAHWLPAMLMGVDAQGYIPPQAVPQNRRNNPERWYALPGSGNTEPISQRAPLYLDPNNANTVRTVQIRGRPPTSFFPDWNRVDPNDPVGLLPVIADSFDQPILYYAANKFGRPTNMLGDARDERNEYSGGQQRQGPPYYFHQDNIGFTGDDNNEGWDFGNSEGKHPIRESGHELTAPQILEEENQGTFARYILDRKVYQNIKPQNPPANTPLRPVNPETYLLISPGVDGKYGTSDDISNLPPWQD